ncbi:hypothetical protein FGO68_gene5314 [Halteria grandinella]|uniref:Uncharacterized protein n=1 Tax=Halteria grandinella TaxID=5974 RepID=A0A8J8NL92_HALGN|nr:hypothetical protein FGO68_gene5314 [Halteria grandinella]
MTQPLFFKKKAKQPLSIVLSCKHYKNQVLLQCSQCSEYFPCRFCHNQAKYDQEKDPKKQHELKTWEAKAVSGYKCGVCGNCQDVGKASCERCNSKFGAYWCLKCHIFENDLTKKIYHCDKCKICRQGGADNFKHCDTCGACISRVAFDTHKCQENTLHSSCPICMNDQFNSIEQSIFLPCGHSMHKECFKDLSKHKYQCPLCFRSFCDMRMNDKALEREIESTPMPEEFRSKKVQILCNDCQERSQVFFHILGAKCQGCNSYNTRQL